MSVTKDVNLGTLVPIILWLFGMTTGAIWWAANQSAEMTEIRSWQVRQDARIERLEETQEAIVAGNARIEAIVQIIRQELKSTNDTLLQEIRESGHEGE